MPLLRAEYSKKQTKNDNRKGGPKNLSLSPYLCFTSFMNTGRSGEAAAAGVVRQRR